MNLYDISCLFGKIGKLSLKGYQEKCRIYLDEYENQEESRKVRFEREKKIEELAKGLIILAQLGLSYSSEPQEINQFMTKRFLERN